ncbi:MAG: hypothetical protein BroJett038_33220 [Chloroflexota bacterium]|nr:MAG: hypothetical protein BroJett038_33220 [Chloroflexota bacterium]
MGVNNIHALFTKEPGQLKYSNCIPEGIDIPFELHHFARDPFSRCKAPKPLFTGTSNSKNMVALSTRSFEYAIEK